jgi:prophage regulatory protein
MTIDMLDRLRLDPGTRTIGELLQEREWAFQEIMRLHAENMRMRKPVERQSRRANMPSFSTADAELTARRLLRLPEVCKLAGLCRSSVYRLAASGQFPSPVRVSERSVRWRMADILAWQDAK